MSGNHSGQANRSSVENDVIHRWQQLQSVRSIAAELHLTRYTVTRIIAKHRQDRDAEAAKARVSIAKRFGTGDAA